MIGLTSEWGGPGGLRKGNCAACTRWWRCVPICYFISNLGKFKDLRELTTFHKDLHLKIQVNAQSELISQCPSEWDCYVIGRMDVRV